jgi:hypothetical protein
MSYQQLFVSVMCVQVKISVIEQYQILCFAADITSGDTNHVAASL